MKKIILFLAVVLAPMLTHAQVLEQVPIPGVPVPIDRAMSPWARNIVKANDIFIFQEVAGIRSGDTLLTKVRADTIATTSGSSGEIFYDPESLTNASKTGVSGVTVQLGQENHIPVINKSGSLIENGKPVFMYGVDATTELNQVYLSNTKKDTISPHSNIGLATEDIPKDSIGMVTTFGVVRDINTSGLGADSAVYADTIDGGLTTVRPRYPYDIIEFGTVQKSNVTTGKIHVNIDIHSRPVANKSYSFTSAGIGAGTYYVGGFYDAPATDITLTDGSLTQTHGSAGNAYAAHPFIVAGAAGTVDQGQVGLRVRGASITDEGVYTAVDTAIVTTDITTLSTDDYVETSLKFLGTITFELYEVSGTPGTYTIDFNYGYAKYEDFGNVDFSVYKIEVVGLSRANDTSFDVTLFKHTSSGWIYSAAAFEPGNNVIADWSDCMAPDDNLTNGEPFAWKKVDLNEFVHGDADEGVIVRIVTGANNSVQAMDVHIIGFVESL